jgi:hypothetical protein
MFNSPFVNRHSSFPWGDFRALPDFFYLLAELARRAFIALFAHLITDTLELLDNILEIFAVILDKLLQSPLNLGRSLLCKSLKVAQSVFSLCLIWRGSKFLHHCTGGISELVP